MAEQTEPPTTGDARVDDALRAVGDLSGLSVAEQYQRLSSAQAALSAVLAAPPESQSALPGVSDAQGMASAGGRGARAFPHHMLKA